MSDTPLPNEYIASLRKHEGLMLRPYQDTMGKLSIGYGRNLTNNGISHDEAEAFLQVDAAAAMRQARTLLLPTVWDALGDVRQCVLAEMVFNMGLYTVQTFRHMMQYIAVGDFANAAKEMLASGWADQVGQRAVTLAKRMETGAWEQV